MWKWLTAGALIFGIVPESVQAQDTMGANRIGRFSQPSPPVAAASPYTNPYAMNPYARSSYTVSPYTSGNPYLYGNPYALGSAPMSSGTGGAGAEYDGQGYGGTGYGQPGTAQTARLAAATLFGLPSANGRVQWPLGLRILAPANETKALREQLEAVLYFVATQAAEGQVNRTFIDFGLQAVRDFRRLLRPRQGTIATFTYTEATRFLDRAERGLIQIRKIGTGPGGTYP
jgi:hypothetical protein